MPDLMSDKPYYDVSDCVPLFHFNLPLSPLIEEDGDEPPPCAICGKPASGQYEGLPLCEECAKETGHDS
jgi:hypothetical protein